MALQDLISKAGTLSRRAARAASAPLEGFVNWGQIYRRPLTKLAKSGALVTALGGGAAAGHSAFQELTQHMPHPGLSSLRSAQVPRPHAPSIGTFEHLAENTGMHVWESSRGRFLGHWNIEDPKYGLKSYGEVASSLTDVQVVAHGGPAYQWGKFQAGTRWETGTGKWDLLFTSDSRSVQSVADQVLKERGINSLLLTECNSALSTLHIPEGKTAIYGLGLGGFVRDLEGTRLENGYPVATHIPGHGWERAVVIQQGEAATIYPRRAVDESLQWRGRPMESPSGGGISLDGSTKGAPIVEVFRLPSNASDWQILNPNSRPSPLRDRIVLATGTHDGPPATRVIPIEEAPYLRMSTRAGDKRVFFTPEGKAFRDFDQAERALVAETHERYQAALLQRPHPAQTSFGTFPGGGNFHKEEAAPPAHAPASPVVFDRGHVEAANHHVTEETALAGDPHVTTRVNLHDAPLDMQQVDKMYHSRVKFGTPL